MFAFSEEGFFNQILQTACCYFIGDAVLVAYG